MQEIEAAVIDTVWCGGIRAEALACQGGQSC